MPKRVDKVAFLNSHPYDNDVKYIIQFVLKPLKNKGPSTCWRTSTRLDCCFLEAPHRPDIAPSDPPRTRARIGAKAKSYNGTAPPPPPPPSAVYPPPIPWGRALLPAPLLLHPNRTRTRDPVGVQKNPIPCAVDRSPTYRNFEPSCLGKINPEPPPQGWAPFNK